MNIIKIIMFNLISLLLILSSMYLIHTGNKYWGWYLALGVASHLIVLGNLRDLK